MPSLFLRTVAVGDSVKNLDQIAEGAMANITYNEVVTLLNLRQKGPGSREARRSAYADETVVLPTPPFPMKKVKRATRQSRTEEPVFASCASPKGVGTGERMANRLPLA